MDANQLRKEVISRFMEFGKCSRELCSSEYKLFANSVLPKYTKQFLELNEQVRNKEITQKKADAIKQNLRKQQQTEKELIEYNKCCLEKCKQKVLEVLEFIKQQNINCKDKQNSQVCKALKQLTIVEKKIRNNKVTYNDVMKVIDVLY